VILIICNKSDLCVDYVVRILRQKGKKLLRLNTEDMPKRELTIRLPAFEYTIGDGLLTFDMRDLTSVWFRRPGRPYEDFPPEARPSAPIQQYVVDQWNRALDGLRALRNVLWINDPGKNQDAECKIRQLRMAREVGLNIPCTCITSRKSEAIDFAREHNGRIVAKALYSPLLEYPDKDYFIFTTAISSFEDVSEEQFALAPVVLQELLSPKTDYRVTVVGKEVFACRIESTNGEQIPIDWRIKKNGLDFIPTAIPEDISTKCKDLVGRLGLVFGAIDLARVGDEYVFLEINPNGEWGWLQDRFPIAETICEYLIAGANYVHQVPLECT